MKLTFRLMLLPLITAMHCFLIAGFITACAVAVWQWLTNSKG